MEHTPTPWNIAPTHGNMHDEYSQPFAIISHNSGKSFNILAGCFGDTYGGLEMAEANAQRIVDCVNSCEGINPEAVPDMLQALEILSAIHDGDDVNIARNALKKAKGIK